MKRQRRPTLRVISHDLGQHPDRRHRSGTELLTRIFAIGELLLAWDGYTTQTLAPVATTPSMGEEVVPDFAGVGLLSDITYRRRREKLEMELGGPLFDELLQPA